MCGIKGEENCPITPAFSVTLEIIDHSAIQGKVTILSKTTDINKARPEKSLYRLELYFWEDTVLYKAIVYILCDVLTS